jgi:hypothetical protein
MLCKSKKGVELAINTVVIIIIALVVLGIVLMFVTGAFQKLILIFNTYPKLEIPPDSDNPISFIPSIIERGKNNKMTIGFYNDEDKDISRAVLPKISCSGISNIHIKSAGILIPVGQTNTYSAIVNIPRTVEPNMYSCTMLISKTEKSFFMDVK